MPRKGGGPATPTTARITPTPTLPPGGHVSATISGVGALSHEGDFYGIAAEDTAVWVYNTEAGTLVRIDPKTNKVVATIILNSGAGQLVYVTPGAVWSANYNTDSVSRIPTRWLLRSPTNRGQALSPLATGRCGCVTVTVTPPG